jgi:hypothetical protein
MAKKEKHSRFKKNPRKYQKKLTLYGMEFEKVVDAVLKYTPEKKKGKRKKNQTTKNASIAA